MKKLSSLIIILTLSCKLTMFAQGGSWSAVGSSLNFPVKALCTDSAGALFAGGTFVQTGAYSTGIAKWNGSSWSQLGGGALVGNGIACMTMDNNGHLIIGGSFTSIGGVLSKNVARWNGTVWSALGDGLEYTGATTVSTLLMFNSELYAAGTFTLSGQTAVNYIAKWDGTEWLPLGSGTNGKVLTLCEFNGDLYAGGTFTLAGGVSVNNIAKWDGSDWSDVDGGVEYTGATTVSTLKASSNTLYVGGTFTSAGGTAVNNIAAWDGSDWSDVGGGVEYTGATTVSTLLMVNNNLWAGGTFTTAGGDNANYIARFDGAGWESIGSGTSNPVASLEKSGNTIYVGGPFQVAGGLSTPYIAKWQPEIRSMAIESPEEAAANKEFAVFPNPVKTELTVRLSDADPLAVYSFILYDATGRIVVELKNIQHEVHIERTNIAGGLYFYQINDRDGIMKQEGKISVE